ncbi:MAG: LuxR C-terminal-related transcriptional regulator [Bermanella sp.]
MDSKLQPKFWLLGPKNIQNSLMLGFLQQQLNFECQILDPYSQADNHRLRADDFVCIDGTGLKYERCLQTLEQLPTANKVIIINLEEGSLHERLLQWPSMSGFFYKASSHHQISQGVRAILDGELWFSRKLLSRFMTNNRKTPSKAPDSSFSLTKREKQILNLSASGAKNSEIAETLNVSTHTVKTHMYNLFKKIDVGNRIQAINWAKQHLPAHELSI